jgi:hypothetical protein
MSQIPHSMNTSLTGRTRWNLWKDVEDVAEQESPYGSLIKCMELPLTQGTFKLEYICPMAFLWHLCSKSFFFFQMLKKFPPCGDQAQPALRARLVLYLDDVMPGNPHRPDHGRSYVAIYWAFLDLPDWLLHSTKGWFVLAFVPKRIWSQIPGEQSALMKHLLKAFWRDDVELSFVGLVHLRHNDECLALACEEVAAWLLDGDAVPKVTLAKTMSAFKCCCKCRNVVARIAAARIPAGTASFFLGPLEKRTRFRPGHIWLQTICLQRA